MKKILGLFLVAIAAFSLAACGKEKYANDGVFTAFEVSLNRGVAQVTWVDVTVKDGKVVNYFIDARQGTIVDGAHVWNAKTKKELKFDYGMADASEIGKEWFEQAEALEAYFLAEGADKVTTNDEGYIDNVTGVSVKDGGYTKLAKEALAKANKNVSTAFEVSLNRGVAQITWVDVELTAKGDVKSYFIDARQGSFVEGAHVWNAKTKKELKFDYGMADASEIGKEWFEQAEALEAYFLAEGADKVTTNDKGYIDNVTGVSVKDGGYTKLAKQALKNLNK